jgi:fucose permease
MAYLMFLDPAHNNWPWVLVLFCLMTALVLGNQASTGNRATARFGLLLVGFFLGPIFPTLLGLLLREIAPQFRGTTYGLFFAYGSIGSLMLAPFVGHRARGNAADVFRVPLILALLMTLLAVGFVLVDNR